jgi:flagellar hook assembly protein FlgD
LNGRLVKNLVDEFKSIGTYTVTWDGRNEEGKIVASGIYLLRVVAKGVKTIQKIAVVK